MAEDGFKVRLHVYDLSQGLARQLSMTFLGKAIEAVWHTGLVVYETEYYFSGGIQQDQAGRTPYGTPLRVIELGVTHVPQEVFEEYLQEISPRYTAETYNLLNHNCNNFSNEVAQFLVGTTIPDYILQLPNEVMNSPMGALIRKIPLPVICLLDTPCELGTMHNHYVAAFPMHLFLEVSINYYCAYFAVPMLQRLETTLKSGAVPQAPQFNPIAAARPVTSSDVPSNPAKTQASSQNSSANVSIDRNVDPPAVESATGNEEKKTPAVAGGDLLDEARSKVQEEITKEFAAIMATGTLRASEAAALATRRVMERHGRLNAPMQQG